MELKNENLPENYFLNFTLKRPFTFDEGIFHWMNLYILKRAKFQRKTFNGLLYLKPDKETRQKREIFYDVFKKFSPLELSIVFSERTAAYNKYFLRAEAITRINRSDKLSLKEKEKLKRKVWKINHVYFDMISQLIEDSKLFDKIEEITQEKNNSKTKKL